MSKICDECETVAHCTKHGCIPKVLAKDAMKLALEALETSGDKYPLLERKAITALREALVEQPAQQPSHYQMMAGYKVACGYGVMEGQAFDLAGKMFSAMSMAEQPAQPQQEPVAWRELCRRLYVELFHCDRQMMATLDEEGDPMWQQGATVRDVLADAKAALDTSPPAQQEPVAKVIGRSKLENESVDLTPRIIAIDQSLQTGVLLYTSPPAQRTWVGLTDEERGELWFKLGYMDLMRAIEAKLKEKNT